jgi:hypothetical protein
VVGKLGRVGGPDCWRRRDGLLVDEGILAGWNDFAMWYRIKLGLPKEIFIWAAAS